MTTLASGTRESSLLVPTTVSVASSLSTSATVKLIAFAWSSGVDVSATSEMVGRSLTGVTCNTNWVESVFDPSETVSVMVVEPDWSRAGVMVAVRAPPVPEMTMLAFGTSDGTELVPVTVRFVVHRGHKIGGSEDTGRGAGSRGAT